MVRVSVSSPLPGGWVAHTFSVNEKPLPEGKPRMVDITPFHVRRAHDYTRILGQIAAARAAGADIVILCLHWGAEWAFYPLPVQLDWARMMAETRGQVIRPGPQRMMCFMPPGG